MSATGRTKLKLPPKIKSKLVKYQRRIWVVKLVEGLCAAALGLVLSWIVVFLLDRFYDTTAFQRTVILLVGTVGLALWLPYVCHRWVWKSRRLEQVARMLKVNHPRLGDYLLGIIELVHDSNFENNSEALTRAALVQAEKETADKDFVNDVPYAKHRRWAVIAGVPLLLALVAWLSVPEASGNAFARWLMPWKNIDRFTFTRLESLPDQLILPQAEPTKLEAVLTDESRWNPVSGSAWIGGHKIESKQSDKKFEFALPPFQEAGQIKVRIGDVLKPIKVEPHPRPELVSLTAVVDLPDYLQRTENVRTEIRGGGLSFLTGSNVSLEAGASRPLDSAALDGEFVNVEMDLMKTGVIAISDDREIELSWKDELGLTAKTPLKLKLRAAEDESPTLFCRQLEKKRVIMVKDVLSFAVDAADDFGLKTVGLEWTGQPDANSAAEPADGQKIVFAGNPEATRVDEMTATFSPKSEKIEPQTIRLRVYAEDYLPDRKRVYSQPYMISVLSEEDHAVWLTNRMNDWLKRGIENYERERTLYKRNVELRNLTPEELDRSETRRQIESQAVAEKTQAQQLSALTKAGVKLIEDAAANDQFSSNHLETLAEMMERLQKIHENRMPSVSDLLKKAAQAAASAQSSSKAKAEAGKPSEGDPQSGQSKQPSESDQEASDKPPEKSGDGDSKDSPKSVIDDPSKKSPKSGDDQKTDPDDDAQPATPSISMKESSMDVEDDSKEEEEDQDQEAKPASKSKLTLPSVTLNDPEKKEAGACPAGQKMDDAVDEQEELLAEFEAVMDELQELISNLEGSTFVKRLKAMSRRELVMARDVNDTTLKGFGANQKELKAATVARAKLLAKRQRAHESTLQTIEDDLEAYSNRVQQGKFKTVLAEMRKLDAVKETGVVAERIVANEPGTSIVQAEFLADTFDRWAEQLVGPG